MPPLAGRSCAVGGGPSATSQLTMAPVTRQWCKMVPSPRMCAVGLVSTPAQLGSFQIFRSLLFFLSPVVVQLHNGDPIASQVCFVPFYKCLHMSSLHFINFNLIFAINGSVGLSGRTYAVGEILHWRNGTKQVRTWSHQE